MSASPKRTCISSAPSSPATTDVYPAAWGEDLNIVDIFSCFYPSPARRGEFSARLVCRNWWKGIRPWKLYLTRAILHENNINILSVLLPKIKNLSIQESCLSNYYACDLLRRAVCDVHLDIGLTIHMVSLYGCIRPFKIAMSKLKPSELELRFQTPRSVNAVCSALSHAKNIRKLKVTFVEEMRAGKKQWTYADDRFWNNVISSNELRDLDITWRWLNKEQSASLLSWIENRGHLTLRRIRLADLPTDNFDLILSVFKAISTCKRLESALLQQVSCIGYTPDQLKLLLETDSRFVGNTHFLTSMVFTMIVNDDCKIYHEFLIKHILSDQSKHLYFIVPMQPIEHYTEETVQTICGSISQSSTVADVRINYCDAVHYERWCSWDKFFNATAYSTGNTERPVGSFRTTGIIEDSADASDALSRFGSARLHTIAVGFYDDVDDSSNIAPFARALAPGSAPQHLKRVGVHMQPPPIHDSAPRVNDGPGPLFMQSVGDNHNIVEFQMINVPFTRAMIESIIYTLEHNPNLRYLILKGPSKGRHVDSFTCWLAPDAEYDGELFIRLMNAVRSNKTLSAIRLDHIFGMGANDICDEDPRFTNHFTELFDLSADIEDLCL